MTNPFQRVYLLIGRFVDKLSWLTLGLMAILLGIAPYPVQPQPHLAEKIDMLFSGTLARPIDIFDLFFHSLPLILMWIKASRKTIT